MKNRILVGAAALALAAVPAVVGLWGNASFAESVPVRVPASGQVASPSPTFSPSLSPTPEDNVGVVPRDQRTEPGDDRDTRSATPSQPSTDDSGGQVPRDQRIEPGDDRGGQSGSDNNSGDDSGSGNGSGRDDSNGDQGGSGHGGGDDRGGHGGDD
jgi:hypothetical protein